MKAFVAKVKSLLTNTRSRAKSNTSNLIEVTGIGFVFVGIAHFSHAVALIVIGVFGVWLAESSS